MKKITLRKDDKVKNITCPKCGGVMIYEDSYKNLMCANRESKKCTAGMSYSFNGRDETLIWLRIPTPKPLDNKTGPRNFKFFKELMLRIWCSMHLANNIPWIPREDYVSQDEVEEFCMNLGIEREDFVDIRKKGGGRTDEDLSSIYELPLEKIKEIKSMSIRKERINNAKSK